jgi:uncharacterized membrane protein
MVETATSLMPVSETLNLNGRTVAAGHGMRWISGAWRLFKQRPLKWFGLGLLYTVIEIALSFTPALKLLSMIVTPILMGGLMFACEQFRTDGDVRISHLFAGFTRKLGALALVGLLTLAIISVPALASSIGTIAYLASHQNGDLSALGSPGLLGLLAYCVIAVVAILIIAVIFAIASFAPPLVILHDLTAVSATRASIKGVLRNWRAGIVYGLLLIVMLVVGALPFLLGWLIMMPLSFLSIYVAYRDVFLTISPT